MRADVVVIGLGPGGEEVAERLADAGVDVVGVEAHLVGGECPYYACIPTKMMVRASGLLTEARRVPGMAGDVSVSADWSPVARRIRDEATDDWDDRAAVRRLESKGGRFVRARARLDGPRRVIAGDEVIDVERALVVATGTRPGIPPIPGLDTVEYWTNRDAVKATAVPHSMVVVGGGVVGCELAQTFARFGSRVAIVEGGRHLLANEEPEACQLLHEVFGREGIDVRTGASATGVRRDGDGVVVTLDDGSEVTGERLLVATGRVADLDAINAASLGIPPEARFLPVDGQLRVRGADGVWAIGDVTGGAFTHVAVHQARLVVAQLVGEEAPPFEDHAIPRVTFTDPEVGAVGLTERTARERGIDVRTGMASIPDSSRGWIHKVGNDGFIKVVEDRARGVLVGGSSVGPCGGEVLSMLTVAVQARVPTAVLRRVIGAYPTFQRAVSDALADLAA